MHLERFQEAAETGSRVQFRYENRKGQLKRGFGYVWRLDVDTLIVHLTPSKLDLRKREVNAEHKPGKLFTFDLLRIIG